MRRSYAVMLILGALFASFSVSAADTDQIGAVYESVGPGKVSISTAITNLQNLSNA